MFGKISILIAVYNTAKYLRACLDSVINQSYDNLQIICIDDASTDDSLSILNEYAQKDDRILVLRNEINSGQSKSRNHGLKYCVGDYISMLDSDDYLAKDTFEQIIKVFNENPKTDCVLFDLKYLYSSGDTKPFTYHTDKTVFTGEEAFKMSFNWDIHGVYVLKADIHKRFPYDECTRYTSDDTTTKQHYYASREVRLSKGVYYYRQHEASISNAITIRRFDVFTANFSLKKHLIEMNVDRKYLSIHEQLRWYNLINHWYFFLNHKSFFSKDEIQEITKTFDFHIKTIDKSLIPASIKWRTLYIPFLGVKGLKFWAKYYCSLREKTPKFLLKKRLSF